MEVSTNPIKRSSTKFDDRALRQFFVIASFLALPLLLYFMWVWYPTFDSFRLALTNYDGLEAPKFIGLDNFKEMFATETFRLALTHNLIWILVFITIPTSAGLALALALNQGVRFDRFLKISFYLPLVLAPVVTGLVWSWIYNPEAGLLNTVIVSLLKFLQQLGIHTDPAAAQKIGWLGDPKLALISVIAAALWRQVGYVMVLYLAGLKTLDTEVLEAAKMDGAEGWSLFRHMIFPMLAPVTVIVVVVSVVDSLRAFDLVNVMTNGGPYSQSEVLATYMQKSAFHDYRQGYAAAIAVVLFLITFVFSLIYLRQVMSQEEAQA